MAPSAFADRQCRRRSLSRVDVLRGTIAARDRRFDDPGAGVPLDTFNPPVWFWLSCGSCVESGQGPVWRAGIHLWHGGVVANRVADQCAFVARDRSLSG